jgi:hypothetical protein
VKPLLSSAPRLLQGAGELFFRAQRVSVESGAEATLLLNAVYNAERLAEEQMRRVIGLFRADFADPNALRPELRGAPVFLELAMTPAGTLLIKPQNLLMNLPLARRA